MVIPTLCTEPLQGPAAVAPTVPAFGTCSVHERAQCLFAAIDAPHAAPYRSAFIELDRAAVLMQAHAADCRQREGRPLSPIDGHFVAVKDVFDVAGQVTRAGSRLLAENAPAQRDSVAVDRLRRAGAILVGRTNLSEFAFSGLGVNPHYGTPANPFDPLRVPGGSTAGGAVAVALGWADAALGTDTSGSVRIPAAFCGLAGWKPTWGRVSAAGVFPLAESLDTVGVIAPTIQRCAVYDGILDPEGEGSGTPALRGRLRIGVPSGRLSDDVDPRVAARFADDIARLRASGVDLVPVKVEAVEAMQPIIAKGGFVAHEAFRLHRERLTVHGDAMDPMVLDRMRRGAEWTDVDIVEARDMRAWAVGLTRMLFESVDALVLPTTPFVAPLLAEVADAEGFRTHNAASIRQTMWANILGLCSAVLPSALPVSPGREAALRLPGSLMLFGTGGSDRRLLAVSARVAHMLSGQTRW